MNNRILVIVLLALLVGSYFVGQWLREGSESENSNVYRRMQYQPCDPARETCRVSIENNALTFSFLQPPSAMKSFTVVLRSGSFEPERVSVEFTMPGMDMGENRYLLKPVASEVWQAQVILPMCSMGRSDWVSHLHVEGPRHHWQADFAFQVGKK